MKIFSPLSDSVTFRFIPRNYNGLDNLSYTLINEFTSVEYSAPVVGSFLPDNLGYISFTLLLEEVEKAEGDNFTIKIFNNLDIIYRGKIYFTAQTDLQNYELTQINDNVINL